METPAQVMPCEGVKSQPGRISGSDLGLRSFSPVEAADKKCDGPPQQMGSVFSAKSRYRWMNETTVNRASNDHGVVGFEVVPGLFFQVHENRLVAAPFPQPFGYFSGAGFSGSIFGSVYDQCSHEASPVSVRLRRT